jgi:hypothetical protein
MLIFEAYRDGAPAKTVDLAAAHLLGAESVPMRSEISAKAGRITCQKRAEGAAALALMWEAGSAGRLLLATTRLPEREQPYNLNVELARARLMLLIQKREDWGLFDYPDGAALSEELDKIRKLFVQALAVLGEGGEAAQLADECLTQAVELSEQTALFHASIFLKRRRSRGGERPTLGCVVDPASFSEPVVQRLGEAVDFVSLPMPWRFTEPREGQSDYARLDAWMDWAQRKQMPILGGPLLSFEPGFFPDWIYIWEHDFETLRDMMYEHVQVLVNRYGKGVMAWNVISAAQAYNAFGMNFEQMMELTRTSCAAVKQLVPRATVLVDLALPWGEYYAANPRTIPPMMYADMCVQSGVKFDAFGVRLLLGAPEEGLFVRDLMEVSTKLDEFAGFGKPLHVTACQVPGSVEIDKADHWSGEKPAAAAGRWHLPWGEQVQADWADAFYQLALSKPFVDTVSWLDLSDGPGHYLASGGLCTASLQPKSVYEHLRQLRSALAPRHGKAAPSAHKAGEGRPAAGPNHKP